MHRTIIAVLLKIVLPAAIVVWLFYRVEQDNPQAFRQLADNAKDWPRLIVAVVLEFIAVCITFVRWHVLVRALDLPFRLRDAFRWGFLSYLLNFVSIGAVGGDVFKAYFIARNQPGRRMQAIATVLIDRIIGLYVLVLIASIVLFATDTGSGNIQLAVIRRGTHLCALIGAVGIALAFIPAITHGALAQWLARLPLVGHVVVELQEVAADYRGRPRALVAAALLSAANHLTVTLGLWLAAGALYTQSTTPTLVEHAVIVPLASVAGALPVTPAGLGTFEYAMEFLYKNVPTPPAPAGQGLVVSLAYRVMTIIVAAIGLVYYWTSRKELAELAPHEAATS